jgi:hypothetical protein
LYGPRVNDPSLFLLYSIVDYCAKSQDFPKVRAIMEHHFKNLSFWSPYDPNRKSKTWTSKEDNRFVTAVYASLRTLERRELIKRVFGSQHKRVINSIRPTSNGVLSVVFSNFHGLGEPTPMEHELEEFEDLG